MYKYDEIYPQYGFKHHKGYGTKEHYEAIEKYGITPIISLVKNEGFRADSTHCDSYNRYKIEFLTDIKTNFILPPNLQFNKDLSKQAYKYWGIPYRIYGKVRTYMIKTKRFFLQKL